MTHSKSRNYKIGLFVLGAFVMIVTFVLLLGAGNLLKTTVKMETYFDESVQGLDVGSPVKHRGVQIGSVESIDFVRNEYRDLSVEHYYKYGKYVFVRISLTNPLGIRGRDDTVLRKMIDDGLRVRLTSQGLTGTAYLELDYLDPARNKPLPIAWEPHSVYVPSSPSTITRALASVDQFLKKLDESNVENIAKNLDRFLAVSTRAVEDARVGEVRGEMVKLIGELRETNRGVKSIVERPETQDAPDRLNQSLLKLNKTVAKLDQFLVFNRAELEDAVENIKGASRDMKELTGNAKRYPAFVLFGKPPERTD